MPPMTIEEIVENQKRWNEFTSTLLGSAFQKYETLRDRAWSADARVEYTDCGEKSAKEAWKKSDEAREEFLKLLGYGPRTGQD